MELEELKLYIRADDDIEDDLIRGLQIAAEEYLINADIAKNYTSELYKLAIKMLVNHWYDNRALIGTEQQVPLMFQNVKMQLRYKVV